MQPNNERRPSAASHASSYHSTSQNYGTHLGPTTEIEPILLDLSSEHGMTSPSETYQRRGGTAFLVDQPAIERSKQINSSSLEKVEQMALSYGPSLIKLYKSIIHYNFPVIEDSFFTSYETAAKTNLDPALLAAIYALTVPWLPESSRSSPLVPDEAALESMAFSLFGDSLITPTISTIQAGILLMQRPNIDSKTLNTQLVSAAYELGLQLDCTTWNTTPSEKGLRKRLAWALYMQDKWCSLIHGRPSSISSDNWAVRFLEPSDFESPPLSTSEAAKCTTGQLIFSQMVQLTEILSTVLDTFYTLRAMSEVEEASAGGTRLILERAKPVQIRLKEWFSGLPPSLKMENSAITPPTQTSTRTGKPLPSPPKPSTTGYMHLAYFATEITLHRCIIRSLSSSSSGTSSSAAAASSTATLDPYLTHICRSAAKTRLISAMDFVNRLRPDHLNAFWYFPSRVCFALIGTFGSLLLATAPAQEEVEFYRTRLGEYRWTLGVSAKTAPFLNFAVESLERSEGLLRWLPRRPSTADVVGSAGVGGMGGMGGGMGGGISGSFGGQGFAGFGGINISPPQEEGMSSLPIVLEGDTDREMEDIDGLPSPGTSTGSRFLGR